MNICPECQQGKHDNCDTTGGWDDETDVPVPCDCWVNNHRPNTGQPD